MTAGSDDTDGGASEHRLFFALWPDEALRAQLDTYIVSALPARAGRRVLLEHLHITLIFLGHVPGSRLGCVKQAAARSHSAHFDLVLDRIAWWRQTQVLWLGPAHAPAALGTLVAVLRDELAACGLALESRPFRPHMTLMRKVRRRPLALRFDPLIWKPDGLALIESTPIAGGVRYQRLAFWPFA